MTGKLLCAALVAVGLLGQVRTVDAAVITWSAVLDGGQEVPPNGSLATGLGTVTFDDVTSVLTLEVEWQALTGLGIQAHIHCCAPATGSAPIAVDLWLSADQQPATGSFTRDFDLDTANPFRASFLSANGGTVTSAFAALVAAMDTGFAYYNIHTEIFPGGEIRGNLAPAQAPEPATALLLCLASGAAAFRRFRR